MGWLDAGLMPMENRIQNRQAVYIWTVMKTKQNITLQSFLRELLNHPRDDYTKNWLRIHKDIWIITNFEKKKQKHWWIGQLQGSWKLNALSLLCVPYHSHGNGSRYVSDTHASRTSRVRAGNAQLGNRYKNQYGYQYEHCPNCILNGITKKLKESHVILSCPSVEMERRRMRVTNYIIKLKSQGKTTNQEILRSYLGGDGANPEILLHRGKCMSKIIES